MIKYRGVYKCFVCREPLNEYCIRWSDPFCSTNCAREYFGVEYPANMGDQRPVVSYLAP